MSTLFINEHSIQCNINYIDLNLTVTKHPKTNESIINADVHLKENLNKISVINLYY